MTDGQVWALATGGLVLLYVAFELVRGELRYRWIVKVASRPASAPTSASSGPDSASLPWPAAPPVGGSGPDITRLVADVLLVARGFDPAEERAGVNGSGVLDRAEREAAAVVAALHDREVTV